MLEFTFRIPQKILIALCAALAAYGAFAVAVQLHRLFVDHAPQHWSVGKPGPWGRLLYTDVPICIPDEFVVLPASDQPAGSWFFRDCTKEQALALLDGAGISRADHEALARAECWKPAEGGVRLTPDDKTVLGFSPAVRAAVYSMLLAFQENGELLDPVWFDPATIDRQLAESGLSSGSLRLLKRLLYTTNDSRLLLFADRDTALRQLPDDAERRLFIRAASQKNAVLARLEIKPDSNVEELAAYWGDGGRSKDLVPLLRSLKKAKGEWNASLIYLLPPFMRSRLNTYPFPGSDAGAVKQDCFWTAFNALSTEPDNRLNDMRYVRQLLDRDYFTIYEPSRLGDIVFVATADNSVIHAATYVADDLVFTKNGYHYTQPWILMHSRDMLATYAARYPGRGALKLLYFRKKS